MIRSGARAKTATVPTAMVSNGGAPDSIDVPAAARDAASRPARSGRRAKERLPRSRPRASIGVKVSVVVAGLLAVLVASNLLLLAQLTSVSAQYHDLLTGPAVQAQRARDVQVEFKKQVQEWKDILLRGANAADMKTYTGQFFAEYNTVESLTGRLIAEVKDPQARENLIAFRTQHQVLQTHYERARAVFVASRGRDFHTPDTMVRGQDRPPTNLLDTVVTQLEADVAKAVVAQQTAVQNRVRLLLGIGSVGVLLLLFLLGLVVRRITRPVRRLTRAAHTAAEETLPAAVRRITAPEGDGRPPTLVPFPVETGDELAELAAALTKMQDRTVELAVEQHRRERETAEMLLNLGRRTQALLARVLGYVTELEQGEKDPDVMTALFRIDHATTRARRNAASMTVLAGAPPSPSRADTMSAAEIVRAALSEIEDYVRVDLYHVEPAQIYGGTAHDLTHLLAELMENATHFSPPSTQVTVVGRWMPGAYQLRVIDQGIGMTAEELTAANDRIREAPQASSDVRLLGLHVVGRLAARHEVSVRLEPSAGRGITASVTLPSAVLAPTPMAAEEQIESARDPVVPEPPARTTRALATLEPATGYARSQDDRSASPRDMPVGHGGHQPQPAFHWQQTDDLSQQKLEAPVDPEPVRPWAGLASPRADQDWFGQPRTGVAALVPLDAGRKVPLESTAVPVRVRGAYLDRLESLETAEQHPAHGFGEAPASSSQQLRAFQLEVEAARRAQSEEDR
jgi:signal transduction histidine kinase